MERDLQHAGEGTGHGARDSLPVRVLQSVAPGEDTAADDGEDTPRVRATCPLSVGEFLPRVPRSEIDHRVIHDDRKVALALALRSRNLPYSRIARIVGVPLHTVAAWCFRRYRSDVRPDFEAADALAARL